MPYPCRVRRFALKPKWMFGHLLTVAAALTCLRLGEWQWTRALTTEEAQNWGYALQWPLFSVCFLVGWWRLLRLESRRLDELAEPPGTVPAEPALDAPLLAPPTDVVRAPAAPSAVAVPSAVAGDPVRTEEDEQYEAYNRMLAALAAHDQERDDARGR